jgi:hypothetical protein
MFKKIVSMDPLTQQHYHFGKQRCFSRLGMVQRNLVIVTGSIIHNSLATKIYRMVNITVTTLGILLIVVDGEIVALLAIYYHQWES